MEEEEEQKKEENIETFRSSSTSLKQEESEELVDGLVKTREIILRIMAQDSSNNSATKLDAAERLDHEWDLWVINGMLDNNYAIGELVQAKQTL